MVAWLEMTAGKPTFAIGLWLFLNPNQFSSFQSLVALHLSAAITSLLCEEY
jgi:hypothetical protein